MTFDQSLLLWCVIAPAIISIAAVLIGRFAIGTSDPSTAGDRRASLCYLIACWMAIAVALGGRQGWQWWPEDAWRQAIWPLLGWTLLAIFVGDPPNRSTVTDRSWRWVAAGLLAIWTAETAMPSGEAWQDTYGLHREWTAAVASGCLLNSWSVERMARRGAERWVLWVVLAGWGGALALAASTYASLAEWGLAALGVNVIFAIAASTLRGPRLWSVSLPIMALAASMTAAGRFYSYDDHPWWLYATMLFLPSVVAAADFLVRHRSTWQRIITAAAISAMIVTASVWWILLRETDSW